MRAIRPFVTAAYLERMRAMRGFLIGTAVTVVAIGIFRGVVMSIVAHLGFGLAIALIAVNIALALFWLPIATVVAWLVETEMTSRRRMAAIVVLGAASIVAEAWIAKVLNLAGARTPPFL